MPWLEFKNGLLLKLASILQSLAARLTPETHAPGLQEEAHLQMEDDLSAFSKKRFKVSRPSEDLQKEDGRKLVGEGSIGDVSRPVGERVVRERPLFSERHTAVEPVRKIEERQRGLVPASSSSQQPHFSQQPQSMLPGMKPEPEMEDRAGSVAKSVLPHQSSNISALPAGPFRGRASKAGAETAMPSAEQALEHQETRLSTAAPDAPFQEMAKSTSPKRDRWLAQVIHKVFTRFRPALQSADVSQRRSPETKTVPARHTEPPVILIESYAPTAGQEESQSQPPSTTASAKKRHEPSLVDNEIKIIKSASAAPPRVPRYRLSLPDQTEVAMHNDDDVPETTAQRLLRRQREIAAPLASWPNPPVRVITTEVEHWSLPLPTIFGERNLTSAASSSWKQSPDQENAPGLPALPSEFRSSAESSGAIYPWPELPQIVEEDPDEPRKLLQNHERQMRVLREQRGSW